MRSPIRPVGVVYWLVLVGVSAVCWGQASVDVGNLKLVYTYEDGFADERALDESHQHSTFWVKGAMGPDEPTLMIATFKDDSSMLLFRGHGTEPARLGYRIPVAPDCVLPQVPLFAEAWVDVQLLSSTSTNQPTVGYLAYRTSADGETWGAFQALTSGRHHLDLGRLAANSYIVFLGHQAVIDNLSINVYREPGTWQVPLDFPTIQQAVEAASSGDTIEVAPGEYPGNINFGSKNLVLLGAGGPAGCVIDCQDKARGFRLSGGQTRESVITGFTIRHGYNRQGGGIYLEGASPTITNCVVHECVSESTPEQPAQGGGIYCKGGQPLIQDCWILQNRAYGDGAGSQGGGLYLTQSGAILERCIIGENSSENGSIATFGGGGLYIAESPVPVDRKPMLRGCLIVGNSTAGYGGALQARAACVEMVNCTVVGNRSYPGQTGGGLYLYDACRDQTVSLVNSCILWGNEAGVYGQQIVVQGTLGGAAPTVRYSQVQGGWQGLENRAEDPYFVDPAHGDYHLQSRAGRWSPQAERWDWDQGTSACVDSGDPDLAFAEEYTPAGGRINRGAYGGEAQASKGAGRQVFHVDGAMGSDNNIGLRRTYPLASIQVAIDRSMDGDAVLVWPGEYCEELGIQNKVVLLQSASDAAILTAKDYVFTILDTYQPGLTIRNFVIRGCLEAGILCQLARPVLSNLTLVDNTVGILVIESPGIKVSSCIFWNNQQSDIFGAMASYSCIQRTAEADYGIGNSSRKPRFFDPNQGDYHLQSKFGRYWGIHDVWVVDDYHSPCIDRGDPVMSPIDEPLGNGNRVNMGAYGGTAYASRSAPIADPDLNQDGIVDFRDFAIMAARWLEEMP